MSKTTPVRWWRSDEDRYKSRPSYVAQEQPTPAATQWAVEYLAALNHTSIREVQNAIESMNMAIARSELPADLWARMSAEPDPIADIKHELTVLKMLAESKR